MKPLFHLILKEEVFMGMFKEQYTEIYGEYIQPHVFELNDEENISDLENLNSAPDSTNATQLDLLLTD